MTVAGGSGLACVFDLASKKTEEHNSKAAELYMGGDNGGTCVLNVYQLMGLRDLNVSNWNDFLVRSCTQHLVASWASYIWTTDQSSQDDHIF